MTSPADSDVTDDVVTDNDVTDNEEALGTPETDPADPEAGEERTPRPKLPTIVLTAAVALLVASVAVAGWFGVSWFRAANDDGLIYSSVRDEVDDVARAAIRTMNTLDYRELEVGLKDWADVTTGTLHKEISRLSDKDKKALVDAKWIASSKIRSLAVRELDDRSGKAVVIAAVETTVSIGGAEPKSDFKRIEGTLLRTDKGWKLDVLTPVQSAQQAAPPQSAVPPSR
jgi:Mce-associated membrane protein